MIKKSIHANRVLSTIKQAFNYGVSRGNLQYNPASNIRARDIGGTEKPRERFLTLNEIKKIWSFLDNEKSQMAFHTKCAIKIILLTGVRTSELRLAQWKEINLDESLWTIPAEHCKSGETIRIHLSPQVKALLDELKEICNTGHVICGTDNKQPLSENALSRAINRIQERVGIPHWTALQEMLAAQMLTIHQLQQISMAFAAKSNQPNNKQYFTNTAIKLANTFVQQASLLSRLQGNGGQQINVKQVDVHQGGQAIVGNVNVSPSTEKK